MRTLERLSELLRTEGRREFRGSPEELAEAVRLIREGALGGTTVDTWAPWSQDPPFKYSGLPEEGDFRPAFCVATATGHRELFDALLAAGADPHRGHVTDPQRDRGRATYDAFRGKHVDLAEYLLLELGLDPRAKCPSDHYGGMNLFLHAIRSPLLIQKFLEWGFDPNEPQYRNGAAYEYALHGAGLAPAASVEILLAAGADPLLKDSAGQTALLVARGDGQSCPNYHLMRRAVWPRVVEEGQTSVRLRRSRRKLEPRADLGLGYFLYRVRGPSHPWGFVLIEAELEPTVDLVTAAMPTVEHHEHAELYPVPSEKLVTALLRFRGSPWTVVFPDWRAREGELERMADAAAEQLDCRALAMNWMDTHLSIPGQPPAKKQWEDALKHKDPDKGAYGPETIHGWSRKLGVFMPPMQFPSTETVGLLTTLELRAVARADVERVDILVHAKWPES